MDWVIRYMFFSGLPRRTLLFLKKMIITCGVCLAPVSYGELNTDHELSLTAESIYVGNASRSGEEGESEIQSRIGGNVFYGILEQNIVANLNYNIFRHTYSENTQPSINQWDGNSLLIVRNNSNSLGVNASHSVGRVLGSSDDDLTLANTQQRQTITVAPYTRLKVSGGTFYNLSGSGTIIEYDQSNINNSRRFTLGNDVSRQINRTSHYGAGLDVGEVRFDNTQLALSDYRSFSPYLYFGHNSGKVTYYLMVGHSLTQPEDEFREETKTPIYSADISYSWLVSRFSLGLSQIVTDTSQGSGTSFAGSPDESEGTLDTTPDQIESTSINMSYKNSGVCGRCNLGMSLGLTDNKYFEFSESNEESIRLNVTGSYRLREHTIASLNLSYLDRHYPNSATDEDLLRVDSENLISDLGITHQYGDLNSRIFIQRELGLRSGNDFSTTNFGINVSLAL